MGRVGEMHEIANLAVFLMSPGAEYLTGQTIAIDGSAFQATGANFSALRSWSDESVEGRKRGGRRSKRAG